MRTGNEMKVYKEVISGVIQPHEILHGKPHGNKSWGKLATDAEYAAEGLYLLVKEEPSYDLETQTITGFTESVDEEKKQVIRKAVIEPIPEPVIEARQVEEIKVASEVALSEGFMTSLGFRVKCLAEDQNAFGLSLLLMMLKVQQDPAVKIKVRDYDNVDHELTYDEYCRMCLEMGTYVLQQRYTVWSQVDQIKNKDA
jgi:hypothetical protein